MMASFPYATCNGKNLASMIFFIYLVIKATQKKKFEFSYQVWPICYSCGFFIRDRESPDFRYPEVGISVVT